MKKFIILSFVIILFVSCKKESSITESTGEDVQLFGKWEWTESCGGFAGGYYYPEEGKKIVHLFSPDGMYYSFRNDTITNQSKYSLTKQKSIYSGELLDFIVFESKADDEVIIKLSADSLILGDNYFDGYTSLYKRVK